MSRSTEDSGMKMLLENLSTSDVVTDVGNIDYTNGEQLLSRLNIPLTSITEAFYNIKMVRIFEKFEWEDAFLFLSRIYLKYTSISLSGSHCFVKQCNELPIMLQETTSRVSRVREIVQNKGIAEKYENPVCIFYELTLVNDDLKTLWEKLPVILNKVEEKDYFPLELNVVQDFAGIFNKMEMQEYLKDMCNLVVSAKEEMNVDDEDFRKGGEVVKNDCLTWTKYKVRAKIYNKFIDQMTNPGVDKQINNIDDFIDCQCEQMKRIYSSEMAKEHGITRLELTIHNEYGFNKPLPEHASTYYFSIIMNILKVIKMYLNEAPMYSVSIATMWQKLINCLRNIPPMDVEESVEDFESLLHNRFSWQREWKYFNENSEYVLHAFAIRGEPDYLQVLGLAHEIGDADEIKDVYRIQGFENEKLKAIYLSIRDIYRGLPINGYEMIDVCDYKIVYAENKHPLAIIYSGKMGDYHGNPYVKCRIYLLQY